MSSNWCSIDIQLITPIYIWIKDEILIFYIF
jgi:hypothetical protein